MKYVLASKSPRRKKLLSRIVPDFEIIEAKCDEICNQTEPAKIVETLAYRKANNVANQIISNQTPLLQSHDSIQDISVIGSDTIVALNGEIFGKPQDEIHAAKILKNLQNNWHSVFTGICVIKIHRKSIKETITYYEETKVHMISLSKEQITNYIKTGEPMDKAGAYAIQGYGGKYVDKIDGEFETVMGLSLKKLKSLL